MGYYSVINGNLETSNVPWDDISYIESFTDTFKECLVFCYYENGIFLYIEHFKYINIGEIAPLAIEKHVGERKINVTVYINDKELIMFMDEVLNAIKNYKIEQNDENGTTLIDYFNMCLSYCKKISTFIDESCKAVADIWQNVNLNPQAKSAM